MSHNGRSSVNGLSLAELVISLVLLTGAVIMAATLFQSVLGYQKRVEQQREAAELARNILVEVRSWLKELDNFQNPSAFPGSALDMGDFEVEVFLRPFSTESPNRSLEADYVATRSMTASYLLVDVSVRRGSLLLPMATLVGEPPRELGANPLRLSLVGGSPLPGSLSPDQSIELEATLLDHNGQEIPDIFFQWSVRPIDGVATLTEIGRDGRRAAVVNRARHRDGTWIHTGGTCRIGVGVTYRGRQEWIFSDPILLQN